MGPPSLSFLIRIMQVDGTPRQSHTWFLWGNAARGLADSSSQSRVNAVLLLPQAPTSQWTEQVELTGAKTGAQRSWGPAGPHLWGPGPDLEKQDWDP